MFCVERITSAKPYYVRNSVGSVRGSVLTQSAVSVWSEPELLYSNSESVDTLYSVCGRLL
jgi:hypothetical protein